MLGKKIKFSDLPDVELGVVLAAFPDINLSSAAVYNRALICGVVHTSTSYMRHSNRCDYLLCFQNLNGSKSIGSVLHYISFCSSDCTLCKSYCNHMAIAAVHQSEEVNGIQYLYSFKD